MSQDALLRDGCSKNQCQQTSENKKSATNFAIALLSLVYLELLPNPFFDHSS